MAKIRQGQEQRPNILFILTDNQTTESLGCYGSREHQTPHIDRLAREGVRFTRAFCTNGLCSPTRSSILTGLMPSQHGVHCALSDDLSGMPDDYVVVKEFRTLPLTLKNRGYRTGMIGKWHLGRFREPALGYEHWVTFSQGHTTDFYNNRVVDNGREYEVRDRHIVDFFTDKAIEYIEGQESSQPFYLQLNYDGPYYLPPTCMGPDRKNPFYEKFEGRFFAPFPALRPEMTDYLGPDPDEPDPARPVDQMLRRWLNGAKRAFTHMHNDPATMANMAAQNALLDQGIGRVLEALRRQGLEENTLVVFSTDQSNLYGQHGLWGHPMFTTPSYMYDTTFNVPLIFRHTGRIKPYRTCDTLVGQCDFIHTLLEYAGFEAIDVDDSPGRSFAAALRGEAIPDWRSEIFFEHLESRSVRTAGFFYTKRLEGTGPNELYDLVADPNQDRNVIDRPEYADKAKELDRRLVDFFSRYSDPKYDLWRGGRPKGIVYRPWIFRKIWGEDWGPVMESAPSFVDDI